MESCLLFIVMLLIYLIKLGDSAAPDLCLGKDKLDVITRLTNGTWILASGSYLWTLHSSHQKPNSRFAQNISKAAPFNRVKAIGVFDSVPTSGVCVNETYLFWIQAVPDKSQTLFTLENAKDQSIVNQSSNPSLWNAIKQDFLHHPIAGTELPFAAVASRKDGHIWAIQIAGPEDHYGKINLLKATY